jgi:hypothetical protein
MGYFHYRMLYAAPLVCYIALGIRGLMKIMLKGKRKRGVKKVNTIWRLTRTVLSLGALAIFLVSFLRPAVLNLSRDFSSMIAKKTERTEFRGYDLSGFLSDIPDNSVIASDPATSYMISASTDHFIVVALDQHGSPSDDEAVTRVRNTRDLFDPAIPIDRSLCWLKEKKVEYIVIDTQPDSRVDFFGVTSVQDPDSAIVKMRASAPLVTEVKSSNDMYLFELNWNESVPMDSIPQKGGIDVLTGQGPGTIDEISLSGFTLENDTVRPGDSLVIDLVWRNTGIVPFGLPLEWTIRFDTGFPQGRFYREWYGKQYRRKIERRNGEFYRYTVSGRILGDGTFPDNWGSEGKHRQQIMIKLPEFMAPGEYIVKLSWRRIPYIPNRSLADYLNNNDSYEGMIVAVTEIVDR